MRDGMISHGSLFAGMGAFDAGFADAGIVTSWCVEIDPHARRVLRKHNPGALILEDVRDCGRHNLPPVEVISGGFPCQDVSAAGRGAGIERGTRSGLFFEMARVVHELAPAILLWENVPRLLTNRGGRDMLTVLSELDRIGYSGGWTCLDARWFGVPQRRRRIFGVFARGRAGAERAAEILALRDRRPGHPAPGRAERPGLAPAVTPGARKSSGQWAGEQLTVAHAREADTARCLDSTGGYSPGQGGAVIGFDLAQLTSGVNRSNPRPGDPQPPPCAAGRPMVAGFTLHGTPATEVASEASLAQSLRCRAPGRQENSSRTVAQAGMTVRRLTPTECLRLMGQPDSYLDLDPPLSDSIKYKLCGNSVVRTVAAWLGRRVAAALEGGHL